MQCIHKEQIKFKEIADLRCPKNESTENFGVLLLTSAKFWLSTAAATLLAMTYIGT
jgi:hypothetical protein